MKNLGSLSMVKSGKLCHTFRFPPVFGSCNSKMLLVKPRSSHQRCSMQKGVLRNFTKFTEKHLCQSLSFNKVACLRPAFNRFHNRKTFLFHFSFKLVWLKREIKNISPHQLFMKKMLFYNISGAIHSNNISEIILFEYFRNMCPCHRRLEYQISIIK